MIKEDFLIRMLQEAMRILELIIGGKKNFDEKKKDVDKCYMQFFDRDKTYFIDKTLEELTQTFAGEQEQNQMMKLDILANIIYTDSLVSTDKDEQRELGIRGLFLFEYISKWSNTYSIERERKVLELKELCGIK